MIDQKTKRKTGRQAQLSNISAARAVSYVCPRSSLLCSGHSKILILISCVFSINSHHTHNKTILHDDHTPLRKTADRFQPELHFVSYGDAKHQKAKVRIGREANDAGWFKTVKVSGPEDLPVEFVAKHHEILKLPRGGGCWIWKCPIIEAAMEELCEGDFLVCLDSVCQVNKNATKRFYEHAKDIQESENYDMLCFDLGHKEHRFTTEQIFEAFDVSKNNNAIRNAGQYVGGMLMIQKGAHCRKWLQKANTMLEEDPWLFTDKHNEKAKQVNPDFFDNRHDQSISSVARKLLGCVQHPDETYEVQLCRNAESGGSHNSTH